MHTAYVLSNRVLVEGHQTLVPALLAISMDKGVFEAVTILSATEIDDLRKKGLKNTLDAGDLAILPGVG